MSSRELDTRVARSRRPQTSCTANGFRVGGQRHSGRIPMELQIHGAKKYPATAPRGRQGHRRYACLAAGLVLVGSTAAAQHHHPPQDEALHEKFYSTWYMPDNPARSCCNEADCYPTEIKYIGGDVYARRREDGNYILIPPRKIERNRDNPDGRNHLCAPPPGGSYPSDTVFCFSLGGGT